MVFSRTLNFHSNNLNTKATVLLTFDDLETNPGLYKDNYPVCFKVAGLPAHGPGKFSVTYKSQLVFTKPQVDNNDIISSETFVPIDVGQQTNLIVSSPDPPVIYEFTTPTVGSPNKLIANNKAASIESIGVGFAIDQDNASTALLFNDIGEDSQVVAQFTPVLRAYITSGYQENQVLRGAIQTKVLFSQNLEALKNTTDWLVSRDVATGAYSITPKN